MREIVVLVFKKVVYRHTEYSGLGDFLVEKYGFKTIEEKAHQVYALHEEIPIDREKILFEDEMKAPIVVEENERKYSSLKIYEGTYLDAKITIYILGVINRTEDIVEISDEERYPVYTAEYQMIKLLSYSGYVLQRFNEQLSVDLGLKIGEKEWFFHRGRVLGRSNYAEEKMGEKAK